MKILFFSDIHGLTDNLYLIKKLDEKEHFDKVIVLGDLFEASYYFSSRASYNPEIVKNILNSFGSRLLTIKGNRDFLTFENTIDGPFKLEIDGYNFFLAHGHEPYLEILAKNNILIHGHMHVPYIIKDKNITKICVGSISIARESTEESYGIYNKDKITLYNINNEIIEELYLKD